MDPITIGLAVGAGAQVVSGIMQYYQAEKARKASQERLDQIEAMFNKIVPPDLDISIFDDQRIAQDIPLPSLRLDAITPKDYASIGKQIPEVASFVEEARPELVKASGAAKMGREAQLDALQRYREIASGGFDPRLQEQLNQAARKSQMEAQSRQASVLQDAARRGQLGSGVAMAAQLRAGGDAMDQAAMQSQAAAAEAYRNQLAAMQRSADLGGDIRSSEMSEEARNAGIINEFNQRTSKNYQDWLKYRADLANRANVANLENEQRIADANVSQANQAQWKNREMWNTGQQQQYAQARQKQQDLVDLARQKNAVKQQQFGNTMDIAKAKAGMNQQAMDYINQSARDRNQMVRGIADAVTAGGQYYGKYGQQGQPEQPLLPQSQVNYDDVGGQDQPYTNEWKYKPQVRRW